MKRVKISLAVVALALGIVASAFTSPNRVVQGWFQYISGDPALPASYSQTEFTRSDAQAITDCPSAATTCASKFQENASGNPIGSPVLTRLGTFTPQ